jgi:hypothetical protein
MDVMRKTAAVLLLVLAGCTPEGETERDQAARLRSSVDKFRSEYREAIKVENQLIAETIAWLRGSARSAPRAHAIADARVFMDRWAKVYFVPRWMHEKLRYDQYSSVAVKAVQARVLDYLKRRYFELHDYQRYAQHASESEIQRTPVGYLPEDLKEFQLRLEARQPATNEIDAMLAALPGRR